MRFPDECGHGERACIIPPEKKNRPCTAVAWDPENPTRLAAAWTKVRLRIGGPGVLGERGGAALSCWVVG